MTIYEEKGYKDRKDYVKQLAEEYGVDFYSLASLANILGKDEDFDGLVSAAEDMEDFNF